MSVHQDAARVDDEVARVIERLVTYCRASDWAGYDPYDALTSPVLTGLPFANRRLPRVIFTQALRRSPLNLRPLLGVPKTQNAKALALFLSAFVKLSKSGALRQERLIEALVERLAALRSPGVRHWCWGYPFPWQGRASAVPAGAPNLVCTVFAAQALLDVHEASADTRCLEMARSAAAYLVEELYWTGVGAAAGFSYPLPGLQSEIHNANFLAAALLCRLYRHTGDAAILAPALAAARCSAARQQGDGSWYYGEAASQRWCDNFHSGYNLCALRSIADDRGTAEFDACIRRGFRFYRTAFVRADGRVAYFRDRTYPVDIHAVAQSIMTLVRFSDFDGDNVPLARSVFRWAMGHLWDERGFFYYRKLRIGTIRTPYMRWSQAWMLLALSTLLSEPSAGARRPVSGESIPAVVA
jgi:hypothetical protein